MVSVPDTCAQSRWDGLPCLLVIMVHASLGHSTESCVMPLFPRGGQVLFVARKVGSPNLSLVRRGRKRRENGNRVGLGWVHEGRKRKWFPMVWGTKVKVTK